MFSIFFRPCGFLALSLTVLLTGCIKKNAGDQTEAANRTELLFGEYGSMTGPESTFGISTHKGIIMAVEEANSTGGVKGKKIRVISYDDQGRPDEAVTTVTKLITQDRVSLILGEVASSRSIAAGAIAQQYKIPMISPSSTNPKVTEIGEYIFRVCFIDPFQGSVMAKFAMESLKYKTAAILRDVKADYSVGLANFFASDFTKRGGTVVADLSYSNGDVDFKAQLTAIKGKKPEVLFIPGYYTEVGLIAKQAKEMNYKGVLLGGDGWDSEKLTEIGGDAIVGGYFSNHYSHEDKNPVVQNFVTRYKSKFGEVPNGLAAMGYDAAIVAIDAAKRSADLSSKGLRDAIANTKNFQGVTGIITINDERNAIKPAVVLKVAGNNLYQYVTTINP
ncbi:MAG: ABC transporter substrate-binding protein [Deltaproteobacteria bacterium]|nr:ABC transporter substrate-binding protein [Deltaproteobacteria bacterium]MBI3293129.1 ABC transporter substrate-binding protein [Deltaproteobacteria bacterium]